MLFRTRCTQSSDWYFKSRELSPASPGSEPWREYYGNRGNFHLCPQVLSPGEYYGNRGNFHLCPQVLRPGAKRLRCDMAHLTAEAEHDAPLVKLEQADERFYYGAG